MTCSTFVFWWWCRPNLLLNILFYSTGILGGDKPSLGGDACLLGAHKKTPLPPIDSLVS